MKRLLKHYFSLLLVISGLTSSLSAFAGVDTIKKRGTLRVGVEPGFLPFEMRTPKDEWVGFDVEMIQAFAASLGVKADFVATKWDGIIPGLMAGKYDVIASGMTITEDRAKAVLFSDPYYAAGLKVLLTAQGGTQFKTLKDLDKPTVTVVVKLGTTGDIFATKELKQAKLRRLDGEADAAQSVLLGKADAFIYDKPYIDIYASTQKAKVALLPVQLTTENFALAAKKSDTELVQAFNAFLKDWRAKGGYDKAFKANFEDLTWKLQFPNIF